LHRPSHTRPTVSRALSHQPASSKLPSRRSGSWPGSSVSPPVTPGLQMPRHSHYVGARGGDKPCHRSMCPLKTRNWFHSIFESRWGNERPSPRVGAFCLSSVGLGFSSLLRISTHSPTISLRLLFILNGFSNPARFRASVPSQPPAMPHLRVPRVLRAAFSNNRPTTTTRETASSRPAQPGSDRDLVPVSRASRRHCLGYRHRTRPCSITKRSRPATGIRRWIA